MPDKRANRTCQVNRLYVHLSINRVAIQYLAALPLATNARVAESLVRATQLRR
jgi:hypothetical protein